MAETVTCDDCDRTASAIRRLFKFRFNRIPKRIADKGIIDLLVLCQWCLSKDSWQLVDVGLVNYEGKESTTRLDDQLT